MAKISRKKEIGFAAGMTFISAVFLVQSFLYPAESSQFPRFLMMLQTVFCVVLLARALKQPNAAGGTKTEVAGSRKSLLSELKVPLQIFVASSAYLFAIDTLGYFVASSIFLAGTMYWFGTRKPVVIIGATAGFLLTVYALFVLFIGVRLPQGLLI
ncbi:MAG: tripartite tricarboxylate transporter TctB family protein [Rectinemataceae bacterium]|nr:tripartite tricarboxylate transporter TctB family protein [Rectinemataceae bacterium]